LPRHVTAATLLHSGRVVVARTAVVVVFRPASGGLLFYPMPIYTSVNAP